MLPIRASEGEALTFAVLRILVAILGLKEEFASCFQLRSMIKLPDQQDRSITISLQTLAAWLNEETEIDKQVRVSYTYSRS
jgi:hypothetical protein